MINFENEQNLSLVMVVFHGQKMPKYNVIQINEQLCTVEVVYIQLEQHQQQQLYKVLTRNAPETQKIYLSSTLLRGFCTHGPNDNSLVDIASDWSCCNFYVLLSMAADNFPQIGYL